MKTNQLEGFQIHGLKLLKQIDRGSFGVVYQAQGFKNKKQYAIKIEPNSTKNPQLNFQFDIYQILLTSLSENKIKNYFFPEVYGLFSNNQYTFMVMQKLGENFYNFYKEYNSKIDKKIIVKYTHNMLCILELLHTMNFVYRDIKPENFVLRFDKPDFIVLVDFGLCKMITQKKQKSGNKFKKTLIGTSRYASINAHQGNEITKIDDIESLCYLIIYFLKGRLPWQGTKIKKQFQKNSQVLRMKHQIKVSELCQDLPLGIHEFLQYVRNFNQRDKIDYVFLSDCLKKCLKFYQDTQKSFEINEIYLREQQQKLLSLIKQNDKKTKIQNESLLQKSLSLSKTQKHRSKKVQKKSTKRPLIKRQFLIKQDQDDSRSQSQSSQNQEQKSKFIIY